MSKIEIPEETLKQWNNDALKEYKNCSPKQPYYDSMYPYIEGFINAKSSSYERDKQCEEMIEFISTRNLVVENKNLQQRILELEKDVNKCVGMHSEAFNDFEQEKFEHENSNRYYKEEIAKRDELIKKAKPWMEFALRSAMTTTVEENIEEWLKQSQLLKESYQFTKGHPDE